MSGAKDKENSVGQDTHSVYNIHAKIITQIENTVKWEKFSPRL